MLKDAVKNHYDFTALAWRRKIWVDDSRFGQEVRAFGSTAEMGDVLDIGIGAGDFSGLFETQSTTGVDISRPHLEMCRKLRPKTRLLVADAELLPLKSEQFDVVCSRNLLQHLESPIIAVQEMLRVLKRGGTILSIESAVFENERAFPTAVCKVVEPFHPLFPSHESLANLFTDLNVKGFEQRIGIVHAKWLERYQESKSATSQQRESIYRICQGYPRWYRQKYNFTFFPDELEIESSMTFSMIKVTKP